MQKARQPKRIRKEYRLSKQFRTRMVAALKNICASLGATEAHVTMHTSSGRRYHVGYTRQGTGGLTHISYTRYANR